MPKINTPIVIVAYNRPRSLERLLSSLAKASYPNNNIELIISIDYSELNEEVLAIAEAFKWSFGKKTVKYQETNLGLRSHVLKCGDLSVEFGSVIVLEDDLYVAKTFYYFACEALAFSETESSIGGVSLYNHQLNVHTKDDFLAVEDGYDNWYFQFASSWGQAWTNNQWSQFKNWYANNSSILEDERIPYNVSCWSEKSWLKFYIVYLINKNSYFLCPKISMCTNFSDAGTHVGFDSTNYQVPIYLGDKKTYNFSSLTLSKSVYDAFYENIGIAEALGLSKDELCIDLYDYKENSKKRYWLSTKKLDFNIIKTFGRSLKPIDLNILNDIQGNDIFLYDTKTKEKNIFSDNALRKIIYKTNHISFVDSKILFLNNCKLKFMRLIEKIKG